jgi:hypothetical protein
MRHRKHASTLRRWVPLTPEQRRECVCGHLRVVHENGHCDGYAVPPEPISNGARDEHGWPLDWTEGRLCDCLAFRDEREVYRPRPYARERP